MVSISSFWTRRYVRLRTDPHLRADAVANLPRVLAAEGQTAPYGFGIRALEGEVPGQGVGVGQGIVLAVQLDAAERRLPVHAAV